jgi:prepilin-type N-terminal cleavage/methylation domain-containing protein
MRFLNNKGFTMLEMIIVIFVFLTGIIGAYSVIQNFYNTAIFSSNRFTAMYLSQEGIEIIKNLRDNNLLTPTDWTANILCMGVCKIDYNDVTLTLDPEPYTFLKRDENGEQFYNYDSGLNTIFKRKITTVTNSSPDSITVSVETEWYKGDIKQGSVKVEDILYGYWK